MTNLLLNATYSVYSILGLSLLHCCVHIKAWNHRKFVHSPKFDFSLQMLVYYFSMVMGYHSVRSGTEVLYSMNPI